jgi:hypothetical protein
VLRFELESADVALRAPRLAQEGLASAITGGRQRVLARAGLHLSE